uniref:Uncharacterized protein n=1 Tax=Panagrolaimus sp. ES5 TaxID=591445 RepID=A0AC34F2L3_9BILA
MQRSGFIKKIRDWRSQEIIKEYYQIKKILHTRITTRQKHIWLFLTKKNKFSHSNKIIFIIFYPIKETSLNFFVVVRRRKKNTIKVMNKQKRLRDGLKLRSVMMSHQGFESFRVAIKKKKALKEKELKKKKTNLTAA